MRRKIFEYKTITGMYGLSFALVTGGFLWVYLALKDTPEPLILHYNSITYINQIGGFWSLMGVGVLSLLMLGINFVLSLELKDREWFLGEFISAATIFMSILIFIACAAIISVN